MRTKNIPKNKEAERKDIFIRRLQKCIWHADAHQIQICYNGREVSSQIGDWFCPWKCRNSPFIYVKTDARKNSTKEQISVWLREHVINHAIYTQLFARASHSVDHAVGHIGCTMFDIWLAGLSEN